MSEPALFPRTHTERLLALKKFLEAEHGHRVHLLAKTQEDVRRAEGMNDQPAVDRITRKIPYWKTSVRECNERLEDVNALIDECR